MKYEIYKDGSGQWRWRLKAGNNQIIASGESYYNRADCLKVIGLVKGSSAAEIYDLSQ